MLITPSVRVKFPVIVQLLATVKVPFALFSVNEPNVEDVPQVRVPSSVPKGLLSVTVRPLGSKLPLLFRSLATSRVVKLAAVTDPAVRVRLPLVNVQVVVPLRLSTPVAPCV